MQGKVLKEFVEKCKLEDAEIGQYNEWEISSSVYLDDDFTKEIEYNLMLKTGEIRVWFIDWKKLSYENSIDDKIAKDLTIEDSLKMRGLEVKE